MTMKILYVSCRSLMRGGAERVLSVLSGPLADSYDEVIYFCWYNGEVAYDIDERVKIVFIQDEVKSKSLFKKMKWFRQFVKMKPASIILSFLTPTNMVTLASLFGSGQSVVVSERADPHFYFNRYRLKFLWSFGRNFLYKRARGIIVQSVAERDYYKGELRKKCSIIFNPIYLQPNSVGAAIKIKKKNKIVVVGRLRPFKNQEMAILAFSQFVRIHPDYEMYIYGEGENRKKLESLVLEKGLDKFVHLPGAQKNVFDVISDAQMFLLPSNYEGMSNALIEAMCLGLPCISTKVSGSVDLIDDGINGLLIDCGSEAQLVDAMCKIADNKVLANRLAENATKLFEEIKVDKISAQWIEYLEIMGNQRKCNEL